MYNHEEAVNEAIRAMIAKPIFVCAVSRKVMKEINDDAGYAFAVAGHFYFAAYTWQTGIVLCKSSRTFDEDGVINGYDGGVVVKKVATRRAAKALATRMNRAAARARA
jgi:hypothetical protein